ncbi:MAG TPA: mannose-1-phosphate guanylyltransferase [Desulfobacteria bacterium]|nr:mannose-1-phosphate guanylyltransferase [Desulfobacteria bacterium]
MDLDERKNLVRRDTYAVIMAGGTGTRFWPKSRLNRPKQMLKFFGGESLLRETALRILPLLKWSQIFVVTNRSYAPQIREELPELPDNNIILEPENRDTAACIGLSAVKISCINPRATMICMPADHYISEKEAFCRTIEQAVLLAKQRKNLITIGIPPTSPKTNFGYIKRGEPLDLPESSCQVFTVDQFLEKPSRQRALSFLKSGNYLWNSGIFIWQTTTILEAIERYMPKLSAGLKRVKKYYNGAEDSKIISDEYARFTSMSVDYGILERATNVLVLPGHFPWEDLGSWTALENILVPDSYGNVASGHHLGMDTAGCIIDTEEKLVATLGVRDLIIINTNDTVLVCAKDRDQDIKMLVEGLGASDYSKYR